MMKQTKKQREEKQRKEFIRTLDQAAEKAKSPDAHFDLLSNVGMMLAVSSKETDLPVRIDIAKRALEMSRIAGIMFIIGKMNKVLKIIDENVARKDHLEEICHALLTIMHEGHKRGNKAHEELQNLCDEVKDQ